MFLYYVCVCVCVWVCVFVCAWVFLSLSEFLSARAPMVCHRTVSILIWIRVCLGVGAFLCHCIHICAHLHTHMCTFTNTRSTYCVNRYMYLPICIYVRVQNICTQNMSIHMYIYTTPYVHVYVYIYIKVHMYTYMSNTCKHIHIYNYQVHACICHYIDTHNINVLIHKCP